MKKLKWFWVAIAFVVVVVVSIKVENTFKIAERFSTFFIWDKSDCDQVEVSPVEGFVSQFMKQQGIFNKLTVYVTVNDISDGKPSVLCDGTKGAATNKQTTAENSKEVVRNVPGLDQIVEKMVASYNTSNYSNAVDYAHIGLEMITPVLAPYMEKPFTIEARFARNASAIYLMMAEEAWASRDYSTATTNIQYATKLSGTRPQPELLAMMAAIGFDETGDSAIVFPPQVMQALHGCEENLKSGGDDFIYRYLNALAQTGFIQPILTDDQGRGWYLNLQKYFGFKKPLETKGVFKTEWPNKENERVLTDGLILTMRHAGLGRRIPASSPDFEDRVLPMDFETTKYRFMCTKAVRNPIRLYEKK